ncbi:MAG TPA: CPBP family intramembrane glutamic endopeptidase [Spirochaetia bacterium]|nr:CPBP family intramembrane glutamic endopeptidase [Spirochaetia bacterium]
MEEQKRRALRIEILLVLGVSLGRSAFYSIVDLIGKLTAGKPLAAQSTVLNPTHAANRPWLDLSFQLLQIFFGMVPAFLALHLLHRDREPARGPALRQPDRLGLSHHRVGRDTGTGFLLAAAIGIPGLAFYFASHAVGINTTVVPEALPFVWWTVPVLLLSAVENALLEEVVVVGYLVTRLEELGWSVQLIIATSAILRGSYHLYQGFGGFIGNVVMGLVFALFFVRFRRVGPLIIAHTLLDTFAFVGYALLRGHLSFLQ